MTKYAHHYNAVAAQQRVDKSFAEQHTIREIENAGLLLVADVFEANCISNLANMIYQNAYSQVVYHLPLLLV